MDSHISSKLLYRQIYQSLLPAIQEKKECQAITQQLLEHYSQLDAIRVVLDEPIILSKAQNRLLSAAIKRLKSQEAHPVRFGRGTFSRQNFPGKSCCFNSQT